MEFPENKEEFIKELQGFRHSASMDNEEAHWFTNDLQLNPKKWMALATEEEVSLFYQFLGETLELAVILYQMDAFKTVIINALIGFHNKHQLVSSDQRKDMSQRASEYKQFLDHAVENYDLTENLAEAVPPERVAWFFQTTNNRYLLTTLYLCVFKKTFYPPYSDCVEAKTCFYNYSLAFWKPFEEVEGNTPAQVFLNDMLGTLVAPAASFRKFSGMVDS